ncbi:uncharacterized protein [Procambarus clarkii]|uniref:uncharacterized protein n=1 Tax=Procambarus clarkii TaxID=6728 RepID=UPI001E673152|nr:uncharacterized protein LOC123773928 [Procambarus clarkii]
MNGLNQLVLVILVVAAACEAGMFGAGNIMTRRYPNGPTEFHDMEVPIYGPKTTQPNEGPTNSATGSPADSAVVGVRTGGAPSVNADEDRWWDFKEPKINLNRFNYKNYY